MNDQPGVTELPDQLRDEQALRISELERALEPFARVGDLLEAETTGFIADDPVFLAIGEHVEIERLKFADFRRARSALSPGGK